MNIAMVGAWPYRGCEPGKTLYVILVVGQKCIHLLSKACAASN